MSHIKTIFSINNCRHYVINNTGDKAIYLSKFHEHNTEDHAIDHVCGKAYRSRSFESSLRYVILKDSTILMFNIEEYRNCKKTKLEFKVIQQ